MVRLSMVRTLGLRFDSNTARRLSCTPLSLATSTTLITPESISRRYTNTHRQSQKERIKVVSHHMEVTVAFAAKTPFPKFALVDLWCPSPFGGLLCWSLR
jgi:hypothetical protein